MTTPRNQIPLHRVLANKDGMVTQPWAFYFNQLVQGLPPAGSGYALDGTATSYAPMRLFQGPAANRGSSPGLGDIYFAVDTAQIFVEQGGSWEPMSEMLVGDVLKDPHSNETVLVDVNPNVGQWGSSDTVPILTIDSKGRVTSVSTIPVQAPPAQAVGPEKSIQFKQNGIFAGSAALMFDAALQKLSTTNLQVGNVITFVNPLPTFNNLSPLTTKGDLLVHDATTNLRKAVGDDGQVLQADSTSADGLSWKPRGVLEFPFNFGDATPAPLMSVPAGKVVYEVSVMILTPFDDPAATLSVGDSNNPTGLLDVTDNIPTNQGSFIAATGSRYDSTAQLSLSISPGMSTQGSGLVKITYQQ